MVSVLATTASVVVLSELDVEVESVVVLEESDALLSTMLLSEALVETMEVEFNKLLIAELNEAKFMVVSPCENLKL